MINNNAQEARSDVQGLIEEITGHLRLRVLMCEDDESQCKVFTRQIRDMMTLMELPYELIPSHNVEEFKQGVAENHLAAVIVDILLGDINAIDVLEEMRAGGFQQRIIFISSTEPTADQRRRMIDMNASFYMKPSTLEGWKEILGKLRKRG